MSGERALLLAVALAVGGGCAISLDGADAGGGAADAAVPEVESCVALADPAAGVAGAIGRVRSVDLGGDAGVAVVADSLVVAGGVEVGPAAVMAVGAPAPGFCLASAQAPLPSASGLDVTPLGDGSAGRLLGLFEVAGQRHAYVETFVGFDAVGIALATWDDGRGLFVAAPEYLFTGDRPAYGDAVLVDGDTVYAYGCQGAGFLNDACFVARVPAASVGDRTAYEFYRGGGPGVDFGASIDEAWPLFDGGRGLAVVARDGRVLVAYVTPLGDTITVRAGLGPAGPWSGPVPLARCALPAGAFCGSLAAHPTAAADTLALTYAIGSFEPLPVESRTTRFVQVLLGDRI